MQNSNTKIDWMSLKVFLEDLQNAVLRINIKLQPDHFEFIKSQFCKFRFLDTAKVLDNLMILHEALLKLDPLMQYIEAKKDNSITKSINLANTEPVDMQQYYTYKLDDNSKDSADNKQFEIIIRLYLKINELVSAYIKDSIMDELYDNIISGDKELVDQFIIKYNDILEALSIKNYAVNKGLIFTCQVGKIKIIEHFLTYDEIDLGFKDDTNNGPIAAILGNYPKYEKSDIIPMINKLVNKAKTQNSLEKLLNNKIDLLSHIVFWGNNLDDIKEFVAVLQNNEIPLFNKDSTALSDALTKDIEKADKKILIEYISKLLRNENQDMIYHILKTTFEYCAEHNGMLHDALFVLDTNLDFIKKICKADKSIVLSSIEAAFSIGNKEFSNDFEYELIDRIGEDQLYPASDEDM